MKASRNKGLVRLLVAIVLPAIVASCSTTRRLGADDVLYTGVKKVEIKSPEGQKVPYGVADVVKEAVNVKPNNCLISPSVRWPLPIGLWVYNNWDESKGGLRHWLYEKLVAEPVLISDVRPEVRVEMIDEILDNNGYFSGSASYELVKGRNKKKARIIYRVNTGPEYLIDSVALLPDTCRLYHIIDSVASRSKYFRAGNRYSTDSLSALRVNIANAVRNRGYYFFRPEYIEYQADSTLNRGKIALRMVMAGGVSRYALMAYKTGEIVTTVNRYRGGGVPDTMETRRGTLVQMVPSKLRKDLIPSCIAFREGKTFSVRDMNRTQTNLSRLGIFGNIDINVLPDTTKQGVLNVGIDCTFDAPLEATLEVNMTSKSNSYLGPGLDFSLTNKNMFGGGEQFSVDLVGSYEWQTGSGRSSVLNSYEAGITASLAFPRLIAPGFVPRTHRELNWTRMSVGADLLNRPHYFRLAQFNTALSYDWRASRHVNNTLTLFKLTYTNLLHTTAEFDSIMNENKAIAQSFRSQFIPQISYGYMYSRRYDSGNELNWQFTVQEAGNIFWAAYRAVGDKGEKKLFGTPFSQFVKATTQLVYNKQMAGKSHLVTRLAVGAAHAYGNSTEVPYSEQFYCGGANSVRAFSVRSIGPGSYRVPTNQLNGYFDQTGTFKFEFNVEYRFPIMAPLYGAAFVDTGNVWLLKNDPQRPGGALRGSTFLRDLAVGTGAGVRVDIGMLVVRGDLGIGIHAPYETGKSGYYNMESFRKSLAFHLAIGYPF